MATEPSTPILQLVDLHATAGGTEILRGVDLSVGKGEIHALLGPNGAGKSTLAGIIMGNPLYEVTSGQVLLDGEDITDWSPDVRAKAGVFLAFQYPEAIAGVSVVRLVGDLKQKLIYPSVSYSKIVTKTAFSSFPILN